MDNNLQKLLDLNGEIVNTVEEEYDNIPSLNVNEKIDHFFSSLYTNALSFFPEDSARYLDRLNELEQEAKNEFENLVFDEKSSYKFNNTGTKKKIMNELQKIKQKIHQGMQLRKEQSKLFIAYIHELEKYFKKETYAPSHIPSLAFFAHRKIPKNQQLTSIEKQLIRDATLRFKSRSRSRGGNKNTTKKNKK